MNAPGEVQAEDDSPTSKILHDKEDAEESTRRVRSLIREKLQARGMPGPPSPPVPPEAYHNPRVRVLLEAGGEIIHEKFGCWVIKHACGTKVTKVRGTRSFLGEAEAMRFVAENTTIPLPYVHDYGEDHITMDFVQGETLKTAWNDSFPEADKIAVRRQLSEYIDQLRAIKSPDGSICSFGGRPVNDTRRYFHEGGPFANEASYNDFLVSDLGGGPCITDMVRTQLRDDHDIVLTHGDLHGINILVRPGEGIVAIIDWERCGFYPEYFDLLQPFFPASWECGYYHELLDIFPQRYDAEFLADQVLTMYSKH